MSNDILKVYLRNTFKMHNSCLKKINTTITKKAQRGVRLNYWLQ